MYTVVKIIQYMHASAMNYSQFMEVIEREERMHLMILCSLPIPLVELWMNALKIYCIVNSNFFEMKGMLAKYSIRQKKKQCDLHISLL